MKMKLDSQNRAKIAVAMINKGHTWAEVCAACGEVHVTTLYKDLWTHYEKSGGKESVHYRKLLKRQRENAKKSAKAVKVSNDVHIIETGYVLSKGVEGVKALLEKEGNVVIPLFCEKELAKMAHDTQAAKDYLTSKDTSSVVCIMDNCWQLAVEPSENLSPRVRGIVSLAVDLASIGFEVHIHTNSTFIRRIAKMQGGNIVIDVVT